jgi:hypothetical protein
MIRYILLALTLTVTAAACASDYLDDSEGVEELTTDEAVAAEIEILGESNGIRTFLDATAPQACVLRGSLCCSLSYCTACCAGSACKTSKGSSMGYCW